MPHAVLGPARRREVLLAFREAVTNAVRHSRATSATVGVSAGTDALVITLTDNGIGFDSAATPGKEGDGSRGHGLRSMVTRLTAVGGRCAVTSEPGTGCTVRFSIPFADRDA